MLFQVRLRPSAERELARLPAPQRQRVTRAIQQLRSEPYAGKKLSGEYKGSYSYRVWPHRIIYYPASLQRTVIIIRIGHRQGVYG